MERRSDGKEAAAMLSVSIPGGKRGRPKSFSWRLPNGDHLIGKRLAFFHLGVMCGFTVWVYMHWVPAFRVTRGVVASDTPAPFW